MKVDENIRRATSLYLYLSGQDFQGNMWLMILHSCAVLWGQSKKIDRFKSTNISSMSWQLVALLGGFLMEKLGGTSRTGIRITKIAPGSPVPITKYEKLN